LRYETNRAENIGKNRLSSTKKVNKLEIGIIQTGGMQAEEVWIIHFLMNGKTAQKT
jgi:hypothetical protein